MICLSTTTYSYAPPSPADYRVANMAGEAVSHWTQKALKGIQALQQGLTPTATGPSKSSESVISESPKVRSREDKAYDALAEAKVWFYQVANHLTDEQKHRLFKQLDRLHDVEEWEDGDQPVRQSSFVTFLRTMMALSPLRRPPASGPRRWPNLGLSHQGNLLAVWGDARDRVTLEFLDADQLKWTLSHVRPDGQTVRNAGIGPALDIRNLLSPYNPSHWFDVP